MNFIGKWKNLHIRTSMDAVNTKHVQDECKSLQLNMDQLRKLMELMNQSFEAGLHPETASTAAVKMLPSYVRSVPNGTELGDFIALDLGGTNFRILHISITAEESEMISKIYHVPDRVIKGSGKLLFDHIAMCLAEFMLAHGLMDVEKLPLGFTFSFPCKQEGLTCAKLVNWTKGFTASEVEGKDVVKLLQEACHRRGDISIDVVAVLNDTTGTMMACAFQDSSCTMGVICGTGTNACYMEKIAKIPKIKGEIDASDGLPDEVT